jgi:hypothetical protein
MSGERQSGGGRWFWGGISPAYLIQLRLAYWISASREYLKMPTMAQAIRSYVQSIGGKVTPDQIKRAINAEYPNQWKPSTLQAHLYACVVNNPKAYIHHPWV